MRMETQVAEMSVPPPDSPPHTTAIAAIKAGRALTNALIERRDISGLLALMCLDIRLVGGFGELVVGHDACAEAFRQSFADTDFVTYLRSTGHVKVGDCGSIACETGTWQSVRRDHSRPKIRGDYMAMWRLDRATWRLQAELYVCLTPGPGVGPDRSGQG